MFFLPPPIKKRLQIFEFLIQKRVNLHCLLSQTHLVFFLSNSILENTDMLALILTHSCFDVKFATMFWEWAECVCPSDEKFEVTKYCSLMRMNLLVLTLTPFWIDAGDFEKCKQEGWWHGWEHFLEYWFDVCIIRNANSKGKSHRWNNFLNNNLTSAFPKKNGDGLEWEIFLE